MSIAQREVGYEVSNEDYHASPGVSNSQLKDFARDPRLYHHKYLSGNYKQERKSYFDFGSAVHDLCLLGDNSSIALIPDDVLSKTGAKSGAAWKEFEASNAGKLLLKASEYAAVERCVAAVKAFVREHGVRYLAAPWDGQKTGAFLDQRENRVLIGSLARGQALDSGRFPAQ